MTNVDCIADSIEPEVFHADNRVFTVSYASHFHDHARMPACIMKGYWLDEAGFSTGTKSGCEGNERLHDPDRTRARTVRNRYGEAGARRE